MNSTLRERFARLGPIRAIDRVPSGSPAAFLLRLQPGPIPRTIDAIRHLARRGIPMLRAKQTIEAVLEHGPITIQLPTVENSETLIAELAQAGFTATLLPTGAAKEPAHATASSAES